jgi:hypothetical protein
VAEQSSKLFFVVVSFVISVFFVAKSLVLPSSVGAEGDRYDANEQKFFGSFCQKRTA